MAEQAAMRRHKTSHGIGTGHAEERQQRHQSPHATVNVYTIDGGRSVRVRSTG